ncbi:MAG: YqeG family HAD IIIA-type phosphatase [Firmicutes bacterium]|jgi:HAD superfamily phosphatase (TIGR01668 family)|nr:YqeG family HAD IIIA-type phosphatase [Bacillota bacterium]
MIKHFCPNECLPSLLEVDLDKLKAKGYKGLILDIDNTLLPWAGDEPSHTVLAWVEKAKAGGFQLCLTSNALKERVARVSRTLDIPAIAGAIKPRKKPFRQALQLLGTTPSETVVIGDQLFTDILGGNRMQLYTILIDPVASEELVATKVIRRLERRIIRRLSRKGYISESAAHRRLCPGRKR